MKYLILTMWVLFISITALGQKNIAKDTFYVEGSCGMCKERIENALTDAGVQKADWDEDSHIVSVTYNPKKFNRLKMQKIVAAVGHDTYDVKAPKEVYNNLPHCCKYAEAHEHETGEQIIGLIFQEDIKGKLRPLADATLVALDSKEMATTDSNGVFKIKGAVPLKVSVSMVGFEPDTLILKEKQHVTLILKNSGSGRLEEVVVSGRRNSSFISSMSALNTTTITSKELMKAACCNLSESFETSSSVDVSYADAVTGIKQIQLLGLQGTYTQLLTENLPEIRGLAGSFGLTFIPGPWVESIQLTKGRGSIVNGYESMAGQINIEEIKPDKGDKLFINGYANLMGRLETNINYNTKINPKWSTGLLTHINGSVMENDRNHDNFLDNPIGRQFNVINRWKYEDNEGWIGQLALKYLNDNRTSGQTGYDKGANTNAYGVEMNVSQYTGSFKLGYIFPDRKYQSLGLLINANSYENSSVYGNNPYSGIQNSFYANLIYQNIIGTTDHKFRAGLSFNRDYVYEKFFQTPFERVESVPGGFFEYTYTSTKFTAVAGIRADQHNHFKTIVTPALQLKYNIKPQTNIRFSAGTGMRMANIFADNINYFISARKPILINAGENFGFGFKPERSFNTGLNFVHTFLLKHKGSIAFDFYHTRFMNQTVVDIDASPQRVEFYDLDGKSFSNSFQAELNYMIAHGLEIRTAYRWLDVQTQYNSGLLQKPLIAKHRAFANLAWESGNHKWRADITANWFSKKRLPDTKSNPTDLSMGEYSPSFTQVHTQLTHVFSPKFELYSGIENLTGFTQKQMFIDAANPFGNYFDGSIAWGPVNKAMVYVGFRWKPIR